MSRNRKSNDRKFSRRARNNQDNITESFEKQHHSIPKVNTEPLAAKTPKQNKYIQSIKSKTITFGIGPAGTGKTYIAAVIACDMLLDGQVEQIIITRPAVEAGENLGFLPGDEHEKYAPYIAPFREIMNKRLGKARVEYLLKTEKIRAEPFAYMRGKTFENAIVILDEAQNVTKTQMKLLLTRIGQNCKVIVDGDINQSDIKESGLPDAIKRLSFIPSVGLVEFNNSEIVRSGIVSEIVQAYSRDDFVD